MTAAPPTPPRLTEKILRLMRNGGEEFSFLGDLNEEFTLLCRRRGTRYARAWYRAQLLVNLPPFLKDSIHWSMHMFRNYLLITLRNIRRNKIFSLINITGLAVGMAACLLILLWVRDELSFNTFHEQADDIYLVVGERTNHRGDFFESTPVPLAECLRNDYPEIAQVVRFQFRGGMMARHGGKVFTDWQGAYVDPEMFDVFTFPLQRGSQATALAEVNSVVLTEEAARKMFSDQDPVGRMLEIEGDLVEVTGVLQTIPGNSDIRADYFRPFRSMKEITKFQHFIWNWFACRTYVLLRKGTDPATVNARIADLLNSNRPWSKDPLEVSLFPFGDQHLHAVGGGGPIKYVYIFSVVAGLIILIACINFMNLSTARSAKRAREVGLRKVVGSKRSQLVKQFFLESMIFTALAGFIAIGLAWAAMPLFNELAGKQLQLAILDAELLLGLAAVALFTGFVAGSYPALVLSAFRPIEVLKGTPSLQRRRFRGASPTGARFRRGLVMTQFVLSIGLFACALIVFKQLDFMRHADMGFDKDNLVLVSVPGEHQEKWKVLKNDLARSPNITGVTAASALSHGGTLDWDNAAGDMQYLGTNTDYRLVDYDYIDTHDMRITAGRNFSREFPSDRERAYLINEEAVRQWDFSDPVGRRLVLNGAEGTVIGVYQNQHLGLKHMVKPTVFYLTSKTDWDRYNYLAVRLKAGRIPAALADIRSTWRVHIADLPLEYHFVDEIIDKLYHSEARLSGLINSFTLLAIFISGLGLFGMASFLAQQKTREIGIRKVLGASAPRVVFLLTREFVKWVLLANIVAWPAAYYAMRSWLEDYPYRIDIGFDVFVIAGLIALTIAVLTVLSQSVKAALANPVDSLKYE
jgi:predicted permease